VPPKTDSGMRKILNLKPSETVVSIIACGNAPEQLMVASSPRKDISEILNVIA
jgi:hypothetical protein